MKETKDRKVLPMNFEILRDLESTASLHLISLKSIGFLVDHIVVSSAEMDHIEISDFAYGAARLLDLWMENHMKEIERIAFEFENTDLFLLNSAEKAINISDTDPSLQQIKQERIKEAIYNLNLILQETDLPHDKALKLKEKCEGILK